MSKGDGEYFLAEDRIGEQSDMMVEIKDSINIHRQRAEWDSVISLCKQLLESDPGDVWALQQLADAYGTLGSEDDLIETLVALVNRHHEITPYARLLGLVLKKREEEGAEAYLDQALRAAINRKDITEVEELWVELVDLGRSPSEVFLDYASKLASRKERSLAGELLTLYMDGTDLDARANLQVIRSVVEYMPETHSEMRAPLIEAYKAFYSDRPDIERLIGLSGIVTTESVQEAMGILDRFLKFGEGQFFYHHGWGAGQVRRIEPSQQRVFIDFQKKKGHVLTLEMADKSLAPIPGNDLRALLLKSPDKVREMVESDPVEVVKSTLIAVGGSSTGKEIKALLLNVVVPESVWQKWWTAVNKKLKKDPYVEVTGASLKTYTLREEPETPEEEYARRFRESKTLGGKIELFQGYIDHQGAKCSTELLGQMAQDMISKAQLAKSESEVVATVLSVRTMEETIAVNSDLLDQILTPILRSLDRATNALEGLKAADMQRRWFEMMEDSLQEELAGSYDKLMHDGPDSIRDLVAEHVEKTHEEDVLSRLFRMVRPICREEPGLFIWLSRRLLDSPEDTAREGLTRPAIVEQLVGLHEVLAYRARTSRKDQSSILRAHMSNIRQALKRASFKHLREVLKECDAPTARSLWRTTESAAAIEDRIRKEIIGYVLAHFPSIASGKEGGQEEQIAASLPVRLLCLEDSFRKKKMDLDRLKNVEIPENTKEVEAARLLGDLRENAEYHAAKDKQKLLLALNAQLQEELGSASVVPLEMFSGDSVGFGSAVRIQQDGGERRLIVLGPWESKPEENIISYESPLGRALWGRNVGEAIDMNLGDRTVPVEIVSVEPLAEVPSGASG